MRLKFGTFLALGISVSANANTDLDDFLKCKSLERDDDRLACFDTALKAAESSQSPTTVSSKTEIEPILTSRSNEAFGGEDLARKKQPKEKTPRVIEVAVKDMGFTQQGRHYFVTEDDQRWHQVPSDTRRLVLPKSPEEIKLRIQRRALGSYFLNVVGNKRAIKVKRIK